MDTTNYFENLHFNSGQKINVSRKIDMSFSDTMHWHPFIEILVSLNDHNEVTVNFIQYTLRTNDLIILYPGDLHSINHATEDSFILVQFPIDLLMILSDFNSNFSMFYQYHYIKYDPSNIDADRMVYLIKKLPALYDAKSPFGEVRAYTALLDFYINLGQYCINAKQEEFSGDATTEYRSVKLMNDACLYISQNCTKPLTLDTISHHLGVSKSHFSHLFKKYTDMTFIDYLTTERIKRTEFLISNPSAHFIDIAFDSGFSSVSSFNRAFKKIKGISPSEFRETMMGNTYQSSV